MLIQFLIGGIVSVCNITIHAMVMTAVVSVARASATRSPHPSLLLIITMIATVSVLMAAHVLEVIVWSLAYSIVDAAPAGTNLVYFAFVNYATLGYGDVTPVEDWKLLGPIAAMNGALMFAATAPRFGFLANERLLSLCMYQPPELTSSAAKVHSAVSSLKSP